MPTNIFGNNDTLRQQSVQRMGMDVPKMIQQQWQEAQPRFEEQRQMGRKKFAQDILEEELRNAHQELMNRQEGYRFGQEQDYYKFLQTPEGQAGWKAYQERMGLPSTGPMLYPQQIKDQDELAKEALAQKQHEQAIAESIIRWHQKVPGEADTPEVTWAKQRLPPTVVPGATGQPAPAAPAPPTPRYGPVGTFLHEAVPPLVGGGGAWAAAKAMPGGPYAKGAAGIGAYLLGDRLARMYGGELTPEETAAHPLAAGLGTGAGWLGGALLGGGGLKAARGGPTPPTGPPPLPPGGARVRPGGPGPAPQRPNAPSARVRPGTRPGMAQRFSAFVGSMRGGAAGAGNVPPRQYSYTQPQPGAPPSMSNVPPMYPPPPPGQWNPSMANVTPGGTVAPPPTPMQPGTPYTSQMFPTGSGLAPGSVVPPSATPPSMSNVPSPVANYLGPIMRDPRIMQILQQLYKKTPIPPGAP